MVSGGGPGGRVKHAGGGGGDDGHLLVHQVGVVPVGEGSLHLNHLTSHLQGQVR